MYTIQNSRAMKLSSENLTIFTGTTQYHQCCVLRLIFVAATKLLGTPSWNSHIHVHVQDCVHLHVQDKIKVVISVTDNCISA